MAESEPRTISVPVDVADQVRSRLSQGGYASGDDVLRDAMHALEQQEKLRALRAMVEASISDPRLPMTDEEVETHFRKREATILTRGDHA